MATTAFQRRAGRRWIFVTLVPCILFAGCRSTRWDTAAADVKSQVQPQQDRTEVASSRPTHRSVEEANIELPAANAERPNAVQQVAATNHGGSQSAVRSAEYPDSSATGSSNSSSSASSIDAQPIDLATALLLTAGRSPQVAFAQARIEESRAQLELAEVLWLPSLRAGANYNKHEGRIQDVAGRIIDTSRGSFYSGLGAGGVGAGSPLIPGVLARFHVTDAIFQPRIAQQTICARNAGARATINDSLLATALAHLQLLRATQELAVTRIAVEQFEELERVTREFAAAGQGLESDHDRARAELAIRKNELQRADEAVSVASAGLAQLVRWEYAASLQPAEEILYPVSMVDTSTPARELVAIGLSSRPEISESRYLIGEAVERLNRERYAPLIPSVLLGVSYGGLTGGLGSRMDNSGDRLDADALAFWELRQLGFGDQAAQREARSRIMQTRQRQIALMDQVAREIVESHAQVVSRSQQILSAEEAVSAAQDSFRRNWERIQHGQGLPIEVLQSIQALTSAQKEYVRAIAEHNAAQFTLHRSLGWPVNASDPGTTGA